MAPLLLLAVLCADPVKPAPTALSRQWYYPVAEVEEFSDGGIDPFVWFSTEPATLWFDKPGHVVIGFGQEDLVCDLTAGKAAGTWVATCDKHSYPMTWEWTSRARTNLFSPWNDAGPAIDVVKFDQSPADLRAAADARFAKKVLPGLSGTWVDDAGTRLSVDGKLRFYRCLDGCDENSYETICIEREQLRVQYLVVPSDAGTTVVDAYVEGLCGGGPSLSRTDGGRSYRRATPARLPR